MWCQPDAAMPERKMQLHPLQVCQACDTDDGAHTADKRIRDLAQGRHQNVPPRAPHQMGLAVLQSVMQHAPLCMQVKRRPDQVIFMGAGAVTALLNMIRYEGIISQRCTACDDADIPNSVRIPIRPAASPPTSGPLVWESAHCTSFLCGWHAW